ncbi:MAG: non-heme ferritin [Bacteroidota bacterium]|nr:non-heme ferritin [Bacteroidota bacterium]
MLSENMVRKINEQIIVEHESSNLYLQMSAWCAVHGLAGAAAFLKAHAEEERMHMLKFFDYLLETGNMALLGPAEQPKHEYESLEAMFTQILNHERFVTGKINELVALAYEDKDYATLNFLQWFVAEQREEESLFSSILDKIKMIAPDGRGLYFVDRELAQAAAAPPQPEA